VESSRVEYSVVNTSRSDTIAFLYKQHDLYDRRDDDAMDASFLWYLVLVRTGRLIENISKGFIQIQECWRE
jgi:hypothetical protein